MGRLEVGILCDWLGAQNWLSLTISKLKVETQINEALSY